MRIDSHHSFSERYTLEYLASILKRNRFEGSVVIAEDVADYPEFVRGIVIRADLCDPNLPHLLDRWQLDPRFKGVCHQFDGSLPEGLAEVERRGILLDAAAVPGVLPRMVERCPSLRIAIDHLGMGSGGAADDQWAQDLVQAAAFPQVFCKLSGVARLAASARACVQHAMAVFGPSRLMFGSDWPAGLPDTTWKASLAAFTQAIGAQSIEVREELLGGTACRFYGL
ncbi:MAG TPA: amidohydrolase family protein [Bryobacteraceae bacterium]|nr:amidohydrolase family protein [Bryobacteraceae bacterium]